MSGLMGSGKKKAAQQEAAAAQKRAANAEKALAEAKKPTPLPDETGEASKRSRLRAMAEAQEGATTSESTNLTGSRLGDSSKAVARVGRIKSTVMGA